jgi:hypothetical protein
LVPAFPDNDFDRSFARPALSDKTEIQKSAGQLRATADS